MKKITHRLDAQEFRRKRQEIMAGVSTHARKLNRLLKQALDAGVQISLYVHGHPRFDVATFYNNENELKWLYESAGAEWAIRLEWKTQNIRHVPGGSPYGMRAFCNWNPVHPHNL